MWHIRAGFLTFLAAYGIGALVSPALASGISLGPFSFVFNGVAALATVGGMFCIYLGYKLFTKGVREHRGELKAKIRFVEIMFTGVGPGLFFMAFGALVLMVALISAFLGQMQ